MEKTTMEINLSNYTCRKIQTGIASLQKKVEKGCRLIRGQRKVKRSKDLSLLVFIGGEGESEPGRFPHIVSRGVVPHEWPLKA